MKKTLIAMAAVAVAGVSSAQVTITGKLGFGVRDSSTSAKELSWTDGAVTFAASEDLGGGMTASASTTMAGMQSHGDGATIKGDGSSISLSGPFGAVSYASGASASDRLGVGAGLLISGGTVFGGDSNEVAQFNYTLPSLVEGLGVTFRLGGSKDGNDAVALTNKDAQLRLAYTAGALGLTYNTIGGTAPATDMGVTYDMGIAKFAYAADVTGTYAVDGQGKRTEWSVSVPVSGDLTVAMSTGTRAASSDGSKKRASATEFNAAYALSKRTTVNAAYATVTNTSNVKQTANTIKLVHTF